MLELAAELLEFPDALAPAASSSGRPLGETAGAAGVFCRR
jgi:hypothetical protein